MGVLDDIEGAFKGVGAGYGSQLSGAGKVLTGDVSGGVSDIESGVQTSAQGEVQGAKKVATDVAKVVPWGTIGLVIGAGFLVSLVLSSIARKFVVP